MMIDHTAYARMVRWCQTAMADPYSLLRPQTQMAEGVIVEGKRTITRVPTAEPDKRREGRIANEKFKEMVWKGGTIGEVCDQMNTALGPVDDQLYDVTE